MFLFSTDVIIRTQEAQIIKGIKNYCKISVLVKKFLLKILQHVLILPKNNILLLLNTTYEHFFCL